MNIMDSQSHKVKKRVIFEERPPLRESKFVQIGKRKYVSIRRYGGEPRVNIRQYVEDIHGRPYSTKRGILLTLDEWHQLKKSVKYIDSSLKERPTNVIQCCFM